MMSNKKREDKKTATMQVMNETKGKREGKREEEEELNNE